MGSRKVKRGECERMSEIHVFYFTFSRPHAQNLAVETSILPRDGPVAQLIQLRLRLGQQIVEF